MSEYAREILFRGKRADNGEWIYGGIVHQTDYYGTKIDCYRIIDGANAEDYDIRYSGKVIPDSIGQYIGLQDRNGKKIFEGDVVHYVYNPESGLWNADQLSVIVWDYTGFKMRGIKGTNKYSMTIGWLVTIPCNGSMFEVIGNVHDNPELIKGGIVG